MPFRVRTFNFRYITDCTLFAQVHAIDVSRGGPGSIDSVVVLSRHSVVSVLQYDSLVNGFKTVSQNCYAGDEVRKQDPSSAFRCGNFRVSGQFAVAQLSVDSLTFISLAGDWSSAFSVPVKLSGALKLAWINDVQFLATSSDLVVAVLGQTHSHAWIGRASTVGPNSAAVRVVSVDFAKRTVLMNWSFEALPTEAFSIVPLPAPRGGLLVVSPDTVSYCEDFASSVTLPVNAAAGDLGEGQTIHFLSDPPETPIDLDGSVGCAFGDDLVVFACANGTLLTAHLVRRTGTFAAVTDIVWEPLSTGKSKIAIPSSLAVSKDACLFVGSRFGSSLLFRVSQTEILLPIPVFASLLEQEALLSEIDPTDHPLADLIGMYQKEIHDVKISRSLELGLVDELEETGQITSLVSHPESGVVGTSSSGELLLLECLVPTEVLVELNLRGFDSLVNFSTIDNLSFLVLFGPGGLLLLNSTTGLKECYRILDLPDPILAVIPPEEGSEIFFLLVAGAISSVPLHAEKSIKIPEIHALHAFEAVASLTSVAATADGVTWIARLEGNAVALYRFTAAGGLEASIPVATSDVEITSISLSVDPHARVPMLTLSDANGSLSVYEQSSLRFHTKFASLAKAILVHGEGPEEAELAASVSISDPSRRPVEIHPSLATFGAKLRILSASLIWVNGEVESALPPVLLILIEGRPPLVYKSGENGRFFLQVFDSPDLVSVAGNPVAGLGGVCVPINEQAVLVLVQTDRGELFAHTLAENACGGLSRFHSEFSKNGLATVSPSGELRIHELHAGWELRTPVIRRRYEVGEVGVKSAMSVAGLAVACVQDELDPGMLVQRGSMEDEEAGMGDLGNGLGVPEAATPVMLVNCPVPPSRQKMRIKVFSANLLETVTLLLPLQPHEMVTDLVWAETVLGLGSDVLAIGTTFQLGEEQPAQGRLLLVRVDFAPGLAPVGVDDAADSLQGGKLLYESVKRSAVTVVKDWKGCLAVGLGHRFMFYQWDGVAGRLRGCGMFDMALQITSTAFTRNFMVAGDILRGVHLLRYKEDPVIDFMTGLPTSMAASIQFLAKSPPVHQHSVVNVDVIRLESTVGILSVDKFANLDLQVFSPLHFGQYLRPAVPFQLPSPTVSLVAIKKAPHISTLLMGTRSGSLCQLVPVSEADHHLASSLTGLMVALLPQVGGINPRLEHVGVGREGLPGAVQAIESVDALIHFLYLSTPLQAEIASRIKQPIDLLLQHVARWLSRRW